MLLAKGNEHRFVGTCTVTAPSEPAEASHHSQHLEGIPLLLYAPQLLGCTCKTALYYVRKAAGRVPNMAHEGEAAEEEAARLFTAIGLPDSKAKYATLLTFSALLCH